MLPRTLLLSIRKFFVIPSFFLTSRNLKFLFRIIRKFYLQFEIWVFFKISPLIEIGKLWLKPKFECVFFLMQIEILNFLILILGKSQNSANGNYNIFLLSLLTFWNLPLPIINYCCVILPTSLVKAPFHQHDSIFPVS